MIDSAGFTDLRNYIKRRVAYAKYRVGNTYIKTDLSDVAVLPNGTVRAQLTISAESTPWNCTTLTTPCGRIRIAASRSTPGRRASCTGSTFHVAARLSDNFMPLMSSNWIAVLLISTFFTSSLKADSSNDSSGGVLESFFWMSLVFCRIFSDVLGISFRESCCFFSLICCSMAALRSINCVSSM